MAKLTIALDETLLRDARRVAAEHDATLTELIREYLAELVEDFDATQEIRARRLLETIKRNSGHFGKINWTRDELHERN